MSFLPTNYEVPKTSNGGYMRLEKGTNKIRILSSAIVGALVWGDKDGKPSPYRYRVGEPITAKPKREGDLVKHFWAFAVWNYKEESVQILEITQRSIQEVIEEFCASDEYGDPKGYDITIKREGDGLETKYTVVPSPPKKTADEILKSFKDTPINLNALYDGGNPFDTQSEPQTTSEAQKEAEEIFG